MILLLREGLIFTKLRICQVSRNKTLAKIAEFTVNKMLVIRAGIHKISCQIRKQGMIWV